ncbi:MAG: DNA polymerase III subunit alpha, partial [Ottowia sp.]|nr:DNA polymerase III subunit alpha [Ottowia sp.]
CELLARAWTQGVTKAQAVAEWDWLAELASGLILLSGAAAGPVGQYLLAGDDARAAEVALQLASAFPHRFYLELQRAGRPDDERHVAAAAQLAARMKLPVVATHPVQFVQPEDFEAHEARVCIAEGEILGNPRRPRRFTPDQYFKSSAEMQALFADLPSALANSVEIGRRCNLSLTLGQPRLPDFPVPEGHTIETYFREASLQGLEERLEHLYPDVSVRDEQRPRYLERLEFEIDTILKMGFPGYFLIVGDFINWAKNNGCPVGPGRGSGAGSLVAYALKITDLDPLQYKLLFERFLNPERVSMPDFDIDFCQANRDRVIEYVKSKYGKNAVSQIATFGTMAARAAIRDVGRVMDMSYTFCDGISKLVPNKPGKPVTLQYPPSGLSESEREKYAIAAEPMLRERIEREEEVRTLVEMAQQLEGMTRNVGMHAGGVLIAPGKLTDFCPLYQQPGSESAVSQYDKDDVEAVGLVKFDFLGLATLTILEIAKELIVRRHPGQEQFAFENIPLGDAATYRLFQDGRTEAVFQFESRGMQGMLRDARPTRLEDLIALNALYRPGPMDLIPSFVARKHGREPVEYPHPLVAYHTAWLKVHYTAEFYCANMTVEMDNTDKLKVLYEDALREGMAFEPPDVNRGGYRFEPVSDTLIRYGLGAIKGTGQQAIEAIVAAREGRGEGPAGDQTGPFSSLFDFCNRVDRTRVNKRTVEALIRAGAFDALHLNRAALAAALDMAFEYAAANAANANQGGLFDLMEDGHGSSSQEPELPQVTPWGVKERLSLEKTAVGFYLSGHLFDEVEREVRQFVRRGITELGESREPQLLAGIVSDLRVINGQRGKLALFRLDDKSGVIEARAEEALLNQHRNVLKDDELIIALGRVQPDRFSGGVQVTLTQIWDLPAARCRFGKFLRVAVNGKAPDVRRLLTEFPPKVESTEHGELLRGLPVRLVLERRAPAPGGASGVMAQLQLGEAAQFFPSDAALASWMAQADEGRAAVVYE